MFAALPQRARLGVSPYRDGKRPHLKWTVKGHFIEGRRARRFFKTKAEAETFVGQLAIKAENLGTRATHIDPRLHVMAIEAHDLLAPVGKTILEAATFYRQHLNSVERSCTVNELTAALLESKAMDGKRKRYLKDLKNRYARFQAKFGNRVVATITTAECDDWLRSLRVQALNRNGFRSVLSVLFGYAVARGFAVANPVVNISKAKVIGKAPEVFTPEEVHRLLQSAEPDILPYLAIGAFAGVRPAEIERLDWRDVHLDRNFIEVKASTSKTASRRLVTILPNLKAWLEPHMKTEGPITPPNFRVKVTETRKRAGINKWPQNALRHSYASYHLAHFCDAAALALQMGHTTTKMLFSNYREVVTREAAEAYWEISPAQSKQ